MMPLTWPIFLLENKKYPDALFYGQLALKKLLKAV